MAAKPILSMVVVLLLVIALTFVNSHPAVTTEADEKECAEQFQNLDACIPYVTGNAKKPTPECCADTEKVRGSDPKCLCVLILDSANDSVRLPVAINTTLALLMPAACSSNAKVSDCPRILNLPPNSPDAKIFQDAAAATVNPSSASNSSPGSSMAGSGSDSRVNGGRPEDVVARLLLLGLSISAAVFSI